MKEDPRTYKFDIKDMLPIGVTLVVVGLVLAFGLEIMGDVKDDIATNTCADTTLTSYNESSGLCYNASNTSQTAAPASAEYNATTDGIEGVGKLPEKLPLIATVIVAVIIIGILIRYFTKR